MKFFINIANFELTIILYLLSSTYLTFAVLSDKYFSKSSFKNISSLENRIRCRRYARTFYKPYQHIGTYVYNPYRPYIVPPACVRCPTCCPTLCVYPTPAPVKINYKPDFITSPTTRRTASTEKTWIEACNCNPDGSKFTMCNVTTGQCVCKPHFIGRTCDLCEAGYWKTNKTCEKCNCNDHGSLDEKSCDQTSGKCFCKDGITGFHCDSCLPGYYGSIENGCKKCDACGRKGHICDSMNGKCVCPPSTEGTYCEKCTIYSWGFKPGKGCQSCNCSSPGSVDRQCDFKNGNCVCKEGYQGRKCDKCSLGYYGFPNCKKCICDPKGTRMEDCSKDLCRCNDDGSCNCKINVQGKTCNVCKPGYFGLNENNILGCINCFCFNRSTSCENAELHWDKVRKDKFSVESNSIEELEDILMLPQIFLGDLTTSYGGYLTVNVPGEIFEVYLEGNGVELHHSSKNTEVKLIESTRWQIRSHNYHFSQDCLNDFTRICFMMVLQNVTKIRIDAKNRIQEVLLDRSKSNIPNYPSTHAIEKCKCPIEYSGLSCQSPNEGYYRYYPKEKEEYNWVDKIIGIAKPCECNQKSSHCNPDSGYCKNCSDFTSGNSCETCIEGHYKDENGVCSACLCPSRERNNAKGCKTKGKIFKCICKQGYKGYNCEDCDANFFRKGIYCEPCNCSPFGTIFEKNCLNGICHCKDGFKGDKCDRCNNGREFIQNGICSACDECTQILFNDIDHLSRMLNAKSVMFKNYTSSSWMLLENNLKRYETLHENFSAANERVNDLLKKPVLFDVNKNLQEIQEKVEKINKISNKNIIKTDNSYEKSHEFVILTENMTNNVKKLLNDINHFGNANISSEEALKIAEQTKTYITYISDTIKSLQDDEIFALCSRIIEQMNIIYRYSSDIPFQHLRLMEKMLEDLVTINVFIETDLENAEFLIHSNSDRFVGLKDKLRYLNDKHKLASNELQWVLEKNRFTREIMNHLEQVYEKLSNISKMEFDILENRMKKHMVNSSEIDEIFLKSLEHVQEFENKIKNLSSVFNFTKHEWKIINASIPYKTIIIGINEVKSKMNSSRGLIKNATILINPDDYDDITDNANLAYAFSDRLKKRIDNFRSISKDINLTKNKLNDLKYTILANGKSNNDLTQILHKMETEITSQKNKVTQLEDVIIQSMEISNEMREIEMKIENTLFDKEHIFFKVYQEFFNLTSPEEVNNVSNTLRLVRKKLQSLNISLTYINSLDNLDQFKNQNGLTLLRNSLRNLHSKIDYARQAADTINVPLNLANCSMSYKLTKREYFRSLVITFKCQDCTLFSWKKTTGGLFQIYHSKNRTTLNLDDQEVFVKAGNRGSELTIAISRVGLLTKIMFSGMNDKSLKMGSDFNILDIDDTITVGDQSEFATTGYIYQILLNEKKFGLWNFRNTSGNCKGQKRDKSEVPDTNLHLFFSDGGYKVYGINKQFVPRKLSLSFDIKTFDENSLIYLAATEDCQQYVILYLENGYAKFTVSHGGPITNTQKSDNKVNNGENYEIEITMNYKERNSKDGEQQYNLIVRFQERTIERQSNKISLNSSELVKIRRAQHYLGGLPPTFEKTCVKLNVNSFLGYLKPKTPLTNENVSYGISLVSDKVLEYTYAWVNTNGVIILNTSNVEIVTMRFVLKPIEPNGIVFKLNGKQIIYLENSRLVLEKFELVDTDETFLKLNDYNDIEIASVKTKYISINGKKLNLPYFDKIYMEGYLQIGDLKNGFIGGIREIIINDELLPFNPTSLSSFSNVDIGRDKEINMYHNSQVVKSLTVNPNFSNFMQNTEGCAVSKNYKIEQNSVKFGDEQNSYVHIKTNLWKSDYVLGVEFRTLFPNGLIFISNGFKQQSYLILEVRDSKIHLDIKGKRKHIPVIFNKKVSDGKWHRIQLNKKKRKLLVTLDTNIKKPVRIPKITMRNEVYFGGYPQESDIFKKHILHGKLVPFHGCMRYLAINDDFKFLDEKEYDKNMFFSNTGQCFTNIEDGAYFAGNGHAIYDKRYLVSDIFEVSFEFRTTEQNGIIFIVSHPKNSPAFSLELQNGALVMAVDTGSGAIRYASNNLDSDFALCNNQWHNVTTLYSTSELTVIVDGIRKTWVQPESNSVFDKYESAFYIGGIPLDAPTGTLRAKENFNGCLRKLKIGNISVNWSDVNELHNVSLNSCPSYPT